MRIFKIVNTILNLSFQKKQLISPLRLQALLYFSQGWYLSLYNRPLFSDNILIGEREPFVRDVYMRLKHIGAHLILDPVYYYNEKEDAYFCDPIPEEEHDAIDTIRTVWDIFANYKDKELHSLLTEANSPWSQLKDSNPLLTAIRSEKIKDHVLQFVYTVNQG